MAVTKSTGPSPETWITLALMKQVYVPKLGSMGSIMEKVQNPIKNMTQKLLRQIGVSDGVRGFGKIQ